MDFDLNLESEDAAILRQREFPTMLRDVVESGAEQLELTIDAQTALVLAQALEMYNTLTLAEDE